MELLVYKVCRIKQIYNPLSTYFINKHKIDLS